MAICRASLHQYAIISDDRHTIRDWRHRYRGRQTTPPADEYHAASDGQQHDQPADRDAPVADRPCWFCRPPCWPCGTSVLSSSDSLGSVGSASLGSVGSVGFLGLHGDRALGGGRVAGLVYVSTYSPGFAAPTEPDTLTASVAGQRLEFGILFHRHVIHAGEHRRDRVGGRNRLLLIQRSIKTSNDTPLYQNMSTRKTEEHHLPGNDIARERRRHQLRHARSAQHNRHMQS